MKDMSTTQLALNCLASSQKLSCGVNPEIVHMICEIEVDRFLSLTYDPRESQRWSAI
jgi:hypothetical protein